MKSQVLVAGLGHLSSLGQGKRCLLEGLEGKRGPSVVSKNVETQKGNHQIPFYQAPEVSLPVEFPESVKRRMSRISKMYFATALEAIEDAFGSQKKFQEVDPVRVGLVVGSGLACLDSANQYQRRVILEGPTGASPSMFAKSIQNAIASHLSISFGIQGPSSTVTTMEQTTIGSLRLGWDWIQAGIVDHVLVVVGEEMSDYQPYAMAHLDQIPQKLNPFIDACSAVVGEGMGAVLLSREACAPKKYCELLDIQLYAETCPNAERYIVAAYGGQGQWSKYCEWIGKETRPDCHSQLYGSMPTGSIFEILVAAIQMNSDRRNTVCIQMTDHGEVQTVSLKVG